MKNENPAQHDFESRMEQILKTLKTTSLGHRQRIARPLRQADVVCWSSEDATIVDSLKASMRVIAHETLDQCCLQLESALAVCQSGPQKMLLMALVAVQIPSYPRFVFSTQDGQSAILFPGSETITISPLTSEDLIGFDIEWDQAAAKCAALIRIEITKGAGSEAQAGEDSRKNVENQPEEAPFSEFVVSEAEVSENPYQCARQIYDRLENLLSGCEESA